MRLPVNLFLYLASTGLLALAGYTFTLSLKESSKPARTEISNTGRTEAEGKLSAGRGQGPSNSSWNYQMPVWRARFLSPNLVGKDLREQDDKQPTIDPGQQAQRVDIRPLNEIIELVSLMSDTASDGKAGQSHVIIRYKDSASVQPPTWYLLENQSATAGAAMAAPGDGIAASRGNRGNRGGASRPPTPMPSSTAGTEYVQRVWVVGDGSARNDSALWPPYQDIRLVRVAMDARSAYFVRGGVPAAEGAEGQPPAEEELFKTTMEISPDVMRAVVELQRGEAGRQPTRTSEDGQDSRSDRPTDVEETTLVGNRVWVGKKDQRLLQESPEAFLDRVQAESYVSRTGSGLRGVRLTSVPPEIATRYGVTSNDVILSVNGEPVANKTDAYAVGKRQYNRGVRTFVVKILSEGREIERILEAPER